MKSVHYLFGILMTVMVWSCQSETTYSPKIVDNMFSLDLPDYMYEIDIQNTEAALTYGDSIKQRVVMVIYETKEEIAAYGVDMELDVTNYSDIVVEMFSQAFSNPAVKVLDESPKDVNNIPALSFEIRGIFEEIGQEIYSLITVYESDKSFYALYTWCYEIDEIDFGKEAKVITESFKEI
ncbi:MAG: hypothetical protein ACWA41_05165 [Putridiphycobacter sp.]